MFKKIRVMADQKALVYKNGALVEILNTGVY